MTETTTTAITQITIVKTKADFEKAITEAGKKIVLIEFFAEWCGPCKLISPKLKEWAQLYANKIVIICVDVDDLEDLAMNYNVESMPTFVIVQNNKNLETIVGAKSIEQVEQSLQKYCNQNTQSVTLPKLESVKET